jgi:Rieske Fe-S protein
MVALGALVKEETTEHSKARVGTIVKVTPLVLSNMALKQVDEIIKHTKKRYAELDKEYDPTDDYVIRPGKVFSVRWQDDPTKVTIHVAYDDCKGKALINLGTEGVEVVNDG